MMLGWGAFSGLLVHEASRINEMATKKILFMIIISFKSSTSLVKYIKDGSWRNVLVLWNELFIGGEYI